jgi:hypothetical protein
MTRLTQFLLLSYGFQFASAFVISPSPSTLQRISKTKIFSWDDFADLDDDDLLDNEYADENDSQELKAEIGSQLEAPDIDWYGEPIFVEPGTCLPLTEENIQGLLQACRQEIETVFGYSAENRGVGITGGVDFVELDGPTVVLNLKGRFWHERSTVLDRVANYLQQRCPEIIDVSVSDEWQLSDEANYAE